MAKEDKKPYSDKVELKGRLSEFRKALEEEIEAIESNGQNSIVLTNGKRIEGYGKKKIEQIRLENERTNAEIKRKEDEAKPSDPYEDAFKSNEIGDANIEEDLEENNTSDKVVTDNVVK